MDDYLLFYIPVLPLEILLVALARRAGRPPS